MRKKKECCSCIWFYRNRNGNYDLCQYFDLAFHHGGKKNTLCEKYKYTKKIKDFKFDINKELMPD